MALRPGGYPCCEERRRRPVDGACAASREFVYCSEGQAASWNDCIDVGYAEWEAGLPLGHTALQDGDAVAQVC